MDPVEAAEDRRIRNEIKKAVKGGQNRKRRKTEGLFNVDDEILETRAIQVGLPRAPNPSIITRNATQRFSSSLIWFFRPYWKRI